ncbi:MAG: hypothetical protein IBX50_14855 [Marinospirillum sp.]|uniref:hypothetical protein n=1 Tax=Marinospirillum sp. TaxID=2183934 RepID=UPI0019F4A4E2|nr:hypothetical protein [Marinospirillum sp.]MBE0507969.1 hypothetical protein [Marinospirillum sp.]
MDKTALSARSSDKLGSEIEKMKVTTNNLTHCLQTVAANLPSDMDYDDLVLMLSESNPALSSRDTLKDIQDYYESITDPLQINDEMAILSFLFKDTPLKGANNLEYKVAQWNHCWQAQRTPESSLPPGGHHQYASREDAFLQLCNQMTLDRALLETKALGCTPAVFDYQGVLCTLTGTGFDRQGSVALVRLEDGAPLASVPYQDLIVARFLENGLLSETKPLSTIQSDRIKKILNGYQPSQCLLEDGISNQAFPCFLSGRTWNGWERPRFTGETIKQLINTLDADAQERFLVKHDGSISPIMEVLHEQGQLPQDSTLIYINEGESKESGEVWPDEVIADAYHCQPKTLAGQSTWEVGDGYAWVIEDRNRLLPPLAVSPAPAMDNPQL